MICESQEQGLPVSDVLLPYERQPGESSKAFAAFVAFRDMGPDRSVLKAYRQKTGKKQARQPGGLWNGWATAHDWHRRAEAWDRHLDQQAREAHEQGRREMGERHAKIAVALQEKAVQRLKTMKPEELSSADLLRYAIEAAKLERLARGEPEEIREERQKVTGHHEINLFAQIEQLAAAFRPLLRSGLENGVLSADGGAESVHPPQADSETETGATP
jgi:hypothetical protein